MVVRRVVAASAAVTVALVLAACGGGSSSGATSSEPVGGPPAATTTSGSPEQSAGATPVGSAEHPVGVDVGRAPLDWKTVPGPTQDLVTVGDGWTLTVPNGGGEARLKGPRSVTVRAGDHSSITDAFLDDAHALVVSQDRLAADPDRAVLVDLATGRTTTLDGASDPPTVAGGTWALGPDTLTHATTGPRRQYCVATVDLDTGRGTTGWCAPPRHGFSRATITDSAHTMMTFDDHHPSCRTLVQVAGSRLTPIPGVPRCHGWDSSLTVPGAVWSVVPEERRIEAAHFYAHTAGGWYDLGRGTSGSLVTCDGASYFTRDPESRTDPATLLRWDPDTADLTVAYASTGTGNAFLSPPRCGGTHLTLTAYTEAGDEQVTADLG
jgi:hypothetical protein